MATQIRPMEGHSNFRAWCEEQEGSVEFKDRRRIVQQILRDQYADSITFSGSSITSLPPDIGRIDSLMDLNVSNNALTEIVETIGWCHKLQRLDFSQNILSELPLKAMAELTALKTLNLANNHFDVEFLKELAAVLPRGCEVDVRGNGLSKEDQCELESTVECIRKANPEKGPVFRFSTFQL